MGRPVDDPKDDVAQLLDMRQRIERLERTLARQPTRFAFGLTPAFNWSGGVFTQVMVSHDLGRIPQAVIVSSARRSDVLAGDARAPWICTSDPATWTDTQFEVIFATNNGAAIGVFAVSVGAAAYLALG